MLTTQQFKEFLGTKGITVSEEMLKALEAELGDALSYPGITTPRGTAQIVAGSMVGKLVEGRPELQSRFNELFTNLLVKMGFPLEPG